MKTEKKSPDKQVNWLDKLIDLIIGAVISLLTIIVEKLLGL